MVNEVSKSRSLSTTAAVARISAVLSFTSSFVDCSSIVIENKMKMCELTFLIKHDNKVHAV